MDQVNANVDVVGSDGMTPLHYAARYGKNVNEKNMPDDYDPESDDGLSVLKILIKAGGKIMAKEQ